jgi:NTP pyrophosphatase (non-canonical NTP hydrolase)
MSERDDMTEQAYHGPAIVAMPIDAYEVHLNKMAQLFFESAGLPLYMSDKPNIVSGLRAVFSGKAAPLPTGTLEDLAPKAPAVPSAPDHVYSAEQGLDYMLGLQHKVESVWGRNVDASDPEAVSKYIREVILCTTDELHEVLAEVHWKPWKDSRGIKDLSKYRGEMADVLHFILDLYLAGGITGREIIADYLAKHHENLARNTSLAYRAS